MITNAAGLNGYAQPELLDEDTGFEINDFLEMFQGINEHTQELSPHKVFHGDSESHLQSSVCFL